jgi:tetratricopeptide (TPR) repeat protein
VSLSAPLSIFRRLCPGPIALAFALALPGGLCAADQKPERPRNVGEKTSEAFQKLGPLQVAKKFDEMLALLDALVPTLDPNSYDMALILDMKAKIYGTKELYDQAIESWEAALKLSDAYQYFDKKVMLEDLLYLAQFSYQAGMASKVPAVQAQYINKSAGYFKRWLADTPKPSPEIQMFYASILYNQAAMDPKNIDQKRLQEAKLEIQKGLHSTIHPKETFYVLLLAILQQENDVPHSAELLELLVKQYPQNKNYWPSLWATYLNMAGENAKDEAKQREFYVRSIVTLERAQALGMMKTPKENLILVNLYLTAGQFSKANELLYAGLKSGGIDSDPKNWQTLGYYYQQANQQDKAIAALQEASILFPGNGQFEVEIGRIYLQLEKTPDAHKHFREAVRRGGLEKGKEAAALQLLAYAAFELEEFSEALQAVQQAETYAEGIKDTQLPKLKAAIEAAIKEREDARQAPKRF